MLNKLFNIRRNSHGLTAVRGNHFKATLMIAYRSPYATREQDLWLERKLLSIYTQYYCKVNAVSLGRFMDEEGNAITVDYGDGTQTINGSDSF